MTDEPRARLRRLIYGYRAAQCVGAALELGLPEALAGGARSGAELAAKTHTDSSALERLLAVLVGLDLLARDGDRFALTPLGDLLRAEADGTLRGEALHALETTVWRSWGGLADSVRTGSAAFPRIFGRSAWEHREQHPASRARFDAMAAERSRAETSAVLERLVLPPRGLVVDVGGGHGELLAGILAANPELTGVLVEQPQVVNEAEKVLAAAGVESRCQLLAGDFFTALPRGGDLYLLKAVLHNWDDEAAVRLLRVCRAAMSADSRLVIVESVGDAAPPVESELQDLHMLVIHGGRERRTADFRRLLESAGCRYVGVATTRETCCVIEAVAA